MELAEWMVQPLSVTATSSTSRSFWHNNFRNLFLQNGRCIHDLGSRFLTTNSIHFWRTFSSLGNWCKLTPLSFVLLQNMTTQRLPGSLFVFPLPLIRLPSPEDETIFKQWGKTKSPEGNDCKLHTVTSSYGVTSILAFQATQEKSIVFPWIYWRRDRFPNNLFVFCWSVPKTASMKVKKKNPKKPGTCPLK